MPHYEITSTSNLKLSWGAQPADSLRLRPDGAIELTEHRPSNPHTVDCGPVCEALPASPDARHYTDREFPVTQKDDWRTTARNFVLHSQFGFGTTISTNGILSVIAIGGRLHAVHNSNLVGPVTPTPIDPEDWDWHRNKRRVRIFRRAAPKPPVIIPTNNFLDNLPNKLGRGEFLAYAQLASAAPHIEPDGIEKTFQQLLAAASAQHETAAPATSSKKQRQQKLLDLI